MPAEASTAVIEASTHNAGSDHPAPVVPAAVEAKAVDEAIHQADQAAAKPVSTVKSNGGTANGGTANGGTAVRSRASSGRHTTRLCRGNARTESPQGDESPRVSHLCVGRRLGLAPVGAGAGMFGFMYPRFKAGEFGGKFFMGPVAVAAADRCPTAALDRRQVLAGQHHRRRPQGALHGVHAPGLPLQMGAVQHSLRVPVPRLEVQSRRLLYRRTGALAHSITFEAAEENGIWWLTPARRLRARRRPSRPHEPCRSRSYCCPPSGTSPSVYRISHSGFS